ncbi:MAG: DUF3567 domain-containing protein [Rubrivivax sp.]|nr:DUF3567 domain-containing protein [Rubrivivax sp.]
MQMLYNSDSFAVVRIELPQEPAAAATPAEGASAADAPAPRGGYEIVDKTARREIFIEGALAARFQQGVQALVDAGSATEEAFDDYIAGFAGLAQQPLVLH